MLWAPGSKAGTSSNKSLWCSVWYQVPVWTGPEPTRRTMNNNKDQRETNERRDRSRRSNDWTHSGPKELEVLQQNTQISRWSLKINRWAIYRVLELCIRSMINDPFYQFHCFLAMRGCRTGATFIPLLCGGLGVIVMLLFCSSLLVCHSFYTSCHRVFPAFLKLSWFVSPASRLCAVVVFLQNSQRRNRTRTFNWADI